MGMIVTFSLIFHTTHQYN